MGCASSKEAEPEIASHLSSKNQRPPASNWTSANTAGPERKHAEHVLEVTSSSTVPDEATPLLARTSAPLGALSAPPPGDGRSLVLIVWDIENVRLPLNTAPGLSPRHVVRYLKQQFIYGPGRTEYRTVAALTERSLARIRRDHPGFVEQVVPDLTLLLASAMHAKRNADVVLKKELHHFTTEHAHIARACPGQLSIVLISGDEDFLEPVQGALQAGFNVQLVTHDTASGALLGQGYACRPALWSAFLRGASGVRDVVLPYGDEQMHSLLRPRSLLLAGFGQKRGGEAARSHTLRLLSALAARHAAAGASGMASGATSSPAPPAAAATAAAPLAGAGGLDAAMDADLALVEPSFGEFSGSCCVLVTPRRPSTEPAALAAALRHLCGTAVAPGAGMGGGGGVSPGFGANEPRLLVFEARRLLRVTLQADDTWAPANEASGLAAPPAGPSNTAETHADAGAGADGESGGGGAPYHTAAGRGLHDRLSDACERIAALLRGYRLPGPHAAAHPAQRSAGPPHPHMHQQAQQLAVLCRFFRAPGPGEMCCTMLVGAPAAVDAADVLAALTHLRGEGPALLRGHGVTLDVDCMFAAPSAAASAGDEHDVAEGRAEMAGNGSGAPAAAAVGFSELLGSGGDLAAGTPHGRLPALPYRPLSFGSGAGVSLTAGDDTQARALPPPPQQPQQQHVQQAQPSLPNETPAGPGEPKGGAAALQEAAAPGSASEDEGGSGKKKKKKRKKNKKKKKRNKRNSVVPLP